MVVIDAAKVGHFERMRYKLLKIEARGGAAIGACSHLSCFAAASNSGVGSQSGISIGQLARRIVHAWGRYSHLRVPFRKPFRPRASCFCQYWEKDPHESSYH